MRLETARAILVDERDRAMIIYVVFPGLVGILLIALGVRLILRSTLDLHPSLKSHLLVSGVLAVSIGVLLAFPGPRILIGSIENPIRDSPDR